MAFDVSSIVSAVNNYLYSISDINKTLTEEEATAKASGLAGLFEKILNSAVKNKTEEAVKDIDVSSSVSFDDAQADAILAKAMAISSGNAASAASADSAAALGNAQASADSLGIRAEIENNISNHNLLGNMSDSFNTPDIKGQIEESIAQHNRLDEISSYNASRLSAYKNSSAKAANSSVFGDFRL